MFSEENEDFDLDQFLVKVAQDYVSSFASSTAMQVVEDIIEKNCSPNAGIHNYNSDHLSDNISLLSDEGPSPNAQSVTDVDMKDDECSKNSNPVSDSHFESWLLQIEPDSPPPATVPSSLTTSNLNYNTRHEIPNTSFDSKQGHPHTLEYTPQSRSNKSNNNKNTTVTRRDHIVPSINDHKTPTLGKLVFKRAPKRKIWDVDPERTQTSFCVTRKRKTQNGSQLIKSLQKCEISRPKLIMKIRFPPSPIQNYSEGLHKAYKEGQVISSRFNLAGELLHNIGCLPEVLGNADALLAIDDTLTIQHSLINLKIKDLNKLIRLYSSPEKGKHVNLDTDYEKLLASQVDNGGALSDGFNRTQVDNSYIEPYKVSLNVEEDGKTYLTLGSRKLVVEETSVVIPRINKDEIQAFLEPPKTLTTLETDITISMETNDKASFNCPDYNDVLKDFDMDLF